MKEVEVVEDYLVNKRTLALIAIEHAYYRTCIYEMGSLPLYTKESTYNIINRACLLGFSDIEGRIKAFQELTPWRNKAAILLCPFTTRIATPLGSPTSHHTTWLFPLHIDILRLKELPLKTSAGYKTQTRVEFTNGTHIVVAYSPYIVKSQLEKGAYLAFVWKQRKLEEEEKQKSEVLAFGMVGEKKGNYD